MQNSPFVHTCGAQVPKNAHACTIMEWSSVRWAWNFAQVYSNLDFKEASTYFKIVFVGYSHFLCNSNGCLMFIIQSNASNEN